VEELQNLAQSQPALKGQLRQELEAKLEELTQRAGG